MSLLFRINNSLPDTNRHLEVIKATNKLRKIMAPDFEIQLHGSWYMDLAFEDSDIDVAVLAEPKQFGKVLQSVRTALKDQQKYGCFTIKKDKLKEHATVRVIPLIYKYQDGPRTISMEIDLTLQTKDRLEYTVMLKNELETYVFHDLYRAIKVLLKDNYLYGHKVGGLNSFAIGWMIVAFLIKLQEIVNEPVVLKDLDESQLYKLLYLLCSFYLEMHHSKQTLRLDRAEGCSNEWSLNIEPTRLDFEDWRDVRQPWLLKLYVSDNWVSNKTWRYDHIIALFQTFVERSHA